MSDVCVLLLSLSLSAAPPDRAPGPVTGGNCTVRAVKGLAYYDGNDADPLKHKLDLYLPNGRANFPVLLFVHGGTWRSGDKRLYPKLGEVFARNGIGTVIINYRLSPKVKHPAHVEDVARAFAWTVKQIGKYGGNPREVFVSGHSAGGHLAALLATDESYLKKQGLTLADVRGVLALSGVYRILPGVFNRAFGSDAEQCRMASPLTHVKGKKPPFLILHADKDYPTLGFLASQLGGALRRHGTEALTMEIKGRTHVSLIIRIAAGEDDPAAQAMLRFVAKHSSGLRLVPKAKKG